MKIHPVVLFFILAIFFIAGVQLGIRDAKRRAELAHQSSETCQGFSRLADGIERWIKECK